MDLPVMPPVKPMLAKAVTLSDLRKLFAGPIDIQAEPKWDG
jgi:ATP-dependent DNA ligase